MLSDYRVLDLTDEKGFFCGKILADLGAEVIQVEPPSGSPARMLPPFYGGKPDPERSLQWFAYTQGKKGITLDLTKAKGREVLLKLAATANCIIESFPAGHMEKLKLGYDALCGANPKIILTRISAFGQTGPYKDYETSDIVALAMSGTMYTFGEPDRPPVRISTPHSLSYLSAGGEAAAATMMALYHQEMTGEGQVVDASIRESSFIFTSNAPPWWELYRKVVKRAGARREGRGFGAGAGVAHRQIWPCKDGFIAYTIFGGVTGARLNSALAKWIDEEGSSDEFFRSFDWVNFDLDTTPADQREHIEQMIENFFRSQTKEALLEGALKRRIMLYPVCDIEDVYSSVQLKARDFWKDVDHPELKTKLRYPGPFIRSSLVPLKTGERAPHIGEHNREIFGKIGLSKVEIAALSSEGIL